MITLAIKGFSEPRRIPRVGKIYLGTKNTNAEGKEYPKATDHFVVRADGTNTSEQAAAAFHEVYGDAPKEITIAFPSDNPDAFMPQSLSAYKGGPGRSRLWCKGNGETAVREDGNGGYVEIGCPYKDCEIYQAKQCKELTRLIFLLPEVNGIGTWEIASTSYYTSQNLIGSIQLIRQLTRGRIAMIPITLRVVPMNVSVEGRSKTIYVLDLKLENVKMMDLLNRVATIALDGPPPELEPVQEHEAPDDLFVETSFVPDEISPTQSTKATPSNTHSNQREPEAPQEIPVNAIETLSIHDLGDGDTVGVMVDKKFKTKNGADFALVTVAMATTGETVRAMTGVKELVEAIRALPQGAQVHITTTIHEKVETPIIDELALVS